MRRSSPGTTGDLSPSDGPGVTHAHLHLSFGAALNIFDGNYLIISLPPHSVSLCLFLSRNLSISVCVTLELSSLSCPHPGHPSQAPSTPRSFRPSSLCPRSLRLGPSKPPLLPQLQG